MKIYIYNKLNLVIFDILFEVCFILLWIMLKWEENLRVKKFSDGKSC